MSIKMYDLYRYEEGDIFHLWETLPRLRAAYQDSVVMDLAPLGLDVVTLAMAIADAVHLSARGLFNVEASLVIYCDQGDLYVQFFGLPSELLPAGLVECAYQDQSDRPDDVSEIEWEERRVRAEHLLAGDYAWRPGHAGLVYVLADGSDAWHLAERATEKGE